MTRIALILFLLVHGIVTFVSLRDSSIWSVFPPFRDSFSYQMFSDIVISIGVIALLCFLRLKQKKRGYVGLWVMLCAAALLGSFSPLIYLLIEKDLFNDT